MIVLIATVFLPYALVSNCYLVMIFFIRIIREKFEFTSNAHSWSFAIIIVLCRLGSIHVIFLSYYYRERTQLNWKMYMIRPFSKKNWSEFQNIYIHPHSAVDSGQWDLGIRIRFIYLTQYNINCMFSKYIILIYIIISMGGICASDNYIVFADVSLTHHLYYVLNVAKQMY